MKRRLVNRSRAQNRTLTIAINKMRQTHLGGYSQFTFKKLIGLLIRILLEVLILISKHMSVPICSTYFTHMLNIGKDIQQTGLFLEEKIAGVCSFLLYKFLCCLKCSPASLTKQ